ncbi:hypothetical protein [Paraburkholderia hospita]|uniref:hypothetical protein n=1 Tax=Paraburkholderia hospita TaxID=169430 RepID=UPI0012601D90|nr:hypothetical protein [Paraburkholderia hospita]
MYSLQLPVGPDIVVSANEILSPDTGASVQVKGIETKGDTTTVDVSYGIGFKFFFDGPDRMYLKVPVIGRIYYRRVKEPAYASRPVAASSVVAAASRQEMASPVANPASSGLISPAAQFESNSSGTVGQPVVRVTTIPEKTTDGPGVDQYDRALRAAGQGNLEVAIDDLDSAFKAGFRGFALLDTAPEITDLRKDVRYQALVARYR